MNVTRHESKMMQHALDVLHGMIDDGLGNPLSSGEKLALRVLLPIARSPVKAFARYAERENPMYRRGLMEQSLAQIVRAVEQCEAGRSR